MKLEFHVEDAKREMKPFCFALRAEEIFFTTFLTICAKTKKLHVVSARWGKMDHEILNRVAHLLQKVR